MDTESPPVSLTAPTVDMLGYKMCQSCARPVLTEVAYKTRGHCSECFRPRAAEILTAHMVVVAGREKLVLRPLQSNRSPGDRRQRKTAKQRARKRSQAKERQSKINKAQHAANRRLRNLFPEIWEVLLADERAARGLEAFTIDRCLQGGDCLSALEQLAHYSHSEVPA